MIVQLVQIKKVNVVRSIRKKGSRIVKDALRFKSFNFRIVT
jgi:hypothetical protein